MKKEERVIQTFENKYIRKLLRSPWTKIITNEYVYISAVVRKELFAHKKDLKLDILLIS